MKYRRFCRECHRKYRRPYRRHYHRSSQRSHGYWHARLQRQYSRVHRLPLCQRQSQRRNSSRGTQRGAVIRCLTLRRQVLTTVRRRRSRSRVNRTRNDACGNARKQRRIATPPDCSCTKAIDNVAADRATGRRQSCRKVPLLTRMKDVNSAADETISR